MNTIINVNTIPKNTFRNLFTFGFSRIDKAIIREGIAKIIEAISNLVGLSNTLTPVIRLSTFSGTYNSK
ncbi:MAG: hypothetical protein ABJQ32_16605 [Marinobacter alexandrii]